MELFAELFRVYKNKPMFFLSIHICMVNVSICMREKEKEQPDPMTFFKLFFVS